jgi:hypothetical protein
MRDSHVGLLGDRGWLVDRVGRTRAMRVDEVDAARLEDGLWFPNRLQALLTDLRTRSLQTLAGREAYVVTGRTRTLPEVNLYFDKESGLLVRAEYYTDVTLGRYPTVLDVEAYGPVSDVRMPVKWTISEILQRRVSYAVDEITRDGPPLDQARFEKPSDSRADQ